MNRFKKYLPLGLFLLSIPLMGLSTKDAVGCSCEEAQSDKEKKKGSSGGQEIPGGGGVSGSATYSIDRLEMGPSWEMVNSPDDVYRVSATLGHYLSQGRTLSDNYMIHHPMSREVVMESSPSLSPTPEEE